MLILVFIGRAGAGHPWCMIPTSSSEKKQSSTLNHKPQLSQQHRHHDEVWKNGISYAVGLMRSIAYRRICLVNSKTAIVANMTDVGCSLKGSTVSTIARWHHAHTYITQDFHSIILPNLANSCDTGNGVSGHPYMPIHHRRRCSNTLHLYKMDVGCRLKGSTASTTASWHHLNIYISHNFNCQSTLPDAEQHL